MRPFIHINCAMSADGKLAGSDRKQVRISSSEDKTRVKGLRMEYDAILVGVGTIIADDPHLTVKGRSFEENQIRIVLDPKGRTPKNALVVNDAARTIIVTSSECTETWDNADVIRSGENIDLVDVMNRLYETGIGSILVEGGGETISSFFRLGLMDKYTVFVGNLIIGGRLSPTPVDGDGWVREEGIVLKFESCEKLGDGALLTYSSE